VSKGTTIRSFRCPDDPWLPAMERAERDGTTLTAVLVAAVTEYAHPDPKEES
jgi:hypothetical protein